MQFNNRKNVRKWSMLTLALALCLMFGSTPSASAALVISFEAPKSISPGLMTTLDVFIESSDPLNLETLLSFSLKLQISPAFGTIGGLQFIDPQSDGQWTVPGAFTNYVFNVPNNDSFNRVTASLGASVTTSPNTNDTYVGGDIRNDDNYTVVVPGTPKLIARVDLIASLDALGTFNINVIDDGGTQFTSIDPNVVTESGADLTFSLPAAAEITAVPEPSSLALLALFGSGYLVRRYRKRT